MAGIELTGFAGKVAVVTGAGRMRSIGRSLAVELARAGCDVVDHRHRPRPRALSGRRERGRLARH